MRTQILLPAGVAVALTLVALFSLVRTPDERPSDIAVTRAWARATPPGADVGAVYVTIENRGGGADRVTGASSPASQSAMMHETVEENGVATMRHAEPEIPPGTTLEMRPGGLHIMLMGLAAPLAEGETVSLVLSFERAGDLPVEARIASMGADGPAE